MAISSASTLFTCSNFTNNFNSSSQSIPTSISYKRSTITAAYATAERTKMKSTSSSSLYDVLGVRIGADTREIKSAYRKLARVLHPDVGSGDSSADEFMKVHSAYSTLTDLDKRAVYDRSLVQRRAGESFQVISSNGYRCRRWDTDQCW